MFTYRSTRFLVIACASLLLAACATSHVLVGSPRPAIAPDQVKIYLHAPAKYEEIALLDTSSRASLAFTAQGKADKVVERLKIEAAKLGANGILLQGMADRSAGSLGTGFGSATVSGGSLLAYSVGSSAELYQKAA